MVQGGKLKAPKASRGKKVRHTAKRSRENKKGTVSRVSRPGGKSSSSQSEARLTSKAIDRKNEAEIARRAVAGGDRFFAKDISERGESENKKALKGRDKKETKGMKLGDKLKKKLASMGREL